MISVLQVLALDIGTDLLPALALGAEPPEHGVMGRSPRSRSARLLDLHVLGRAFGFLGPVEAIASMAMVPIGAALFLAWPGDPLPTAGPDKAVLSTMVFAAIVVMQMANALECRSERSSLLVIGLLTNRLLVGAIVVEVVMLIGFVYLEPVYTVLGQLPLSAAQWLPVLVTPFVLLAAEETRKAVVRRTQRPWDTNA
jgi:magnesium-transporting ATPase (P-type)